MSKPKHCPHCSKRVPAHNLILTMDRVIGLQVKTMCDKHYALFIEHMNTWALRVR